ncbi:hypothetical protein BDZ91DRAFT_371529 [Kalaharituber pfeilii]|nr:hypothetical protein BDZ91DRAFT_371529 [Kalaharituber pfeilii]
MIFPIQGFCAFHPLPDLPQLPSCCHPMHNKFLSCLRKLLWQVFPTGVVHTVPFTSFVIRNFLPDPFILRFRGGLVLHGVFFPAFLVVWRVLKFA